MPERWLRRHAVQIVAQLPEDSNDALMVLELARTLVESFLAPQPVLEADRLVGDVVAFPTASLNSR